MLIDEQNKKGGLLGKKLEAVVVDPASNWPLFAEKARELMQGQGRASSAAGPVSRKSVLPVFEELNGLLFYPVQYEGEESERNVFYTGAAPNHRRSPPSTIWRRRKRSSAGCSREPTRLSAHHEQDPRGVPEVQGREAEDIMINYTPFGHSDWQTIVSDIKKFGSAGKKTAVVSTINGDANVPFYKELGNQGSRRGHSGRRVLGRRGGACRHRHHAARRSPRGLELLPERRERR